MATKIMICFDGTNNHPNDTEQEPDGPGGVIDASITNVLKLHLLFGGNLANQEGPIEDQHSFYYSGVGTYGGGLHRIFNAAFAPPKSDVGDIINAAGADLKANYSSDDEIFIFGFSRGAAIARQFAAVINDYIEVPDGTQPVRFLGVYDTVASIGAPDIGDEQVSDVKFENNTVSTHVQEALHLLSIDENRKAFRPMPSPHLDGSASRLPSSPRTAEMPYKARPCTKARVNAASATAGAEMATG